MALTLTANGLDLTAPPYYVLDCDLGTAGETRHVFSDYASAPAGTVLAAPPGTRTPSARLAIVTASAAARETALATLLRALSVPNHKLVGSWTGDGRWGIGTLAQTPAVAYGGEAGLFGATVTLQWRLKEAYWLAATPGATVQTGALSALPLLGFETISGATVWGYRLALTPGGSAPAPVKVLFAVTGANSPTRMTLRSATVPDDALTMGVTMAAGKLAYFDAETGNFWDSAMTNVVGSWPSADASGNAVDFSTNNRDLTAAGTITYQQDGPLFGAWGFDGTSGQFTSADAVFSLVSHISECAWVTPGAIGAVRGIMGKGALNSGHALWMDTGGLFNFGVGSGAATRIATGQTVARQGQRYFVCGVWDNTAGQATIYVNGQVEGRSAAGAFTVGGYSGNFSVGQVQPLIAATAFWNGSIAWPDVLNVALTAQQQHAIMFDSLPAYNGTARTWVGTPPALHAELVTTDTLEVRLTHASTAPAGRCAVGWRARYNE